MVIIKVIDGALYQWETGRVISIKPGPMHTVDEVHYMNPRGDTAYVVEPVTKDGEVIAPIPNILLQEAIDIRAFAVMHTEAGDKVVADGTFGVNARQRPSDYVYTEIEFRTYEALADRIEALENNRMPADAVLFVPQSLNPDQQEQARENIGAASHDEIPSALPNPEKLTFEGAVSATYDGSSPVVVNIPKGGSGVHVGSEPPADPSVNVWIDPEGGDGDLDFTIPDALPNPEKLTFTGIQAEYDGSAPVSVMIPTKTSDLKNDSGYVTSVPGALPNPHKLTFTGAVTGEYDGSQAVTVDLPEVMLVEVTESNGAYTADKTQQEILEAYNAGQEVRCIYGAMVLPLVQCTVGFCAFACVYNTSLYSAVIRATNNSVTLTVTDASASGDADLSGYIPSPETAAVGQTVAVKAVDETGKPTQWEAVDMASGGSADRPIELIRTVTIPADIAADTSGVIWSQSTGDTTKPYAWEVNTGDNGEAFNLNYCVIQYYCPNAGMGSSNAFITMGNDVIQYQTTAPGLTISTSDRRAGVFLWDGKTYQCSELGAAWGELTLKVPRPDNQTFVTAGMSTVNKISLYFSGKEVYWPEGATFNIYGVRA